MRVSWTAAAEADLEAVLAYVASERPSAAVRLLDRIGRAVQRVGRFPSSGRPVPETLDDPDEPWQREVIVRPYRIGYAIGEPHWGRGYATESAVRLLRYGFEDLGLSRINASVHGTNVGSIRVLEKLGMVKEGVQRRHTLRFGVKDDLVLFGVLREEWASRAARLE